MFGDFIDLFRDDLYIRILAPVISSWPLWLPLILISAFMTTWLNYKRREWIQSQGSILLEIKLPRDIVRSPAAMELVLYGIWEDVPGSASDVFFGGRVRDWFSLEIVSLGGEVKFFIWAFPKWADIIKSRIYAQYPGAEIHEAEDYSLKVAYDPENRNIWGITTALVKPDAYPIKTYIDYELDKSVGKEQEEIIDPLTPVIEYLGSLKPDEQAWIQIMIQAHRKETLARDAKLFPKPDWRNGVKEEIKKIIEKEPFFAAEEKKHHNLQSLTKNQEAVITAIERNVAKHAYDAMIRVIYTAPKDKFDKMKGMGLIGSMRHFGSGSLNGIKPNWFSGVTYPWEDFNDKKKRENQETLLDAYKRRSFFNMPYRHLNGKPYVLSVEELATIFHFPGTVAATPTLTRIPSKKAQAPSNLPI